MKCALSIFTTIHNCKRSGIKFSGHTNNRGYPHPEHRAWTANTDSNCHPSNIAKPYGARKCRRQSLGMRNMPRIIGITEFTAQQINAMAEIAIGLKTRIEHKENTAADQQNYQWRTPHHIGPGVKKVFELLQ